MAHGIAHTADGFAMAAFRSPAWHKLGVVKPDGWSTTDEAMQAAHCDFEVLASRVAVQRLVDVGIDGIAQTATWEPQSRYVALTRSDDGSILGMVSDRYPIIQTRQICDVMNSLASDGRILIESVFALKNGGKIIVLARMPGELQVTEHDRILPYLFASVDHTGTGATQFGPTAVRVVCANTEQMALQRGTILSIPHKGNTVARLENAQRILADVGVSFFGSHAKRIERLVNTTMTAEERTAYWESLFPAVVETEEKKRTKLEERRSIALELVRANYNREIVERGSGHNAWATYNAYTETVEKQKRRGKDDRARAESAVNTVVLPNGTGTRAKNMALETILAVTTARA